MVVVDSMQAPFGKMVMCHMMADTKEELLDMATKIGVSHKWVQFRGTAREHFDICLSKKKQAIRYGAVLLGWREMVEFMKKKKLQFNLVDTVMAGSSTT